MRNRLSRVLTLLVVLCLLVCFVLVLEVSAEEDRYAPELISVDVRQSSVTAGESIYIDLRIKEDATGLTEVYIQLNNVEHSDYMLTSGTAMATPMFSLGDSYIQISLEVHTNEYTKDGDWYIGYIEMRDLKGNFSRYNGRPDSNQMHSEFAETEHMVNGMTHVEISGSNGDFDRPELSSVSIRNPEVEKPGILVLDLTFSNCPKIGYIQVDLLSDSGKDYWCEQKYNILPTGEGNAYTIEIPINQNRHVGLWEIVSLYITDTNGNQAHYTSSYIAGHFVDYYDTRNAFDLLNFEVLGLQGDETAPAVTDIRILNPEGMVEKPDMLIFEIDLVEDGTGISCVELEYECVDGTHPDINSRGSYVFCLQEYTTSSLDPFVLEEPLKTGTYVWKIPIGSTKPNGTYQLRVRYIEDGAENSYENYNSSGLNIPFTVCDEFAYSFEMSITNHALLERVLEMKEGETGRILLSSRREDNVLTKEILDAIADQDKTLVCYMDGFQWIFNGDKIKEKKTKDLNLTTRIFAVDGHKLSSGKMAICVSFEDNGKLPGVVEFRFKSAFVKEYYTREDVLRLYHVEGESGGSDTDLDYIRCDFTEIPRKDANLKVVLDDGDSWCYVKLSHNSKYIVSAEPLVKLNNSQIGNTTTPTTPIASTAGPNVTDATTVPTLPPATTVPAQIQTQPTTAQKQPTTAQTQPTTDASTSPNQVTVPVQTQIKTTPTVTGDGDRGADSVGQIIVFCIIAGAVIILIGFVCVHKPTRRVIISLFKKIRKTK